MIALLAVSLAFADPADDALEQGKAAQVLGDTEAAVVAYEACLAADPDRVPCWWELGWSHWTAGDWDAVVTAWEQVKTRAPDHPELSTWLPKAKQHQASMAAIRAAAAAAPASVASSIPDGTTLRIRAVGDLMLGTDFPTSRLPSDAAALLDPVRDWLTDADLTFGNLEGPLCDGGTTRKCKPDSDICYAFRSPTRYGQVFADAGFDVVSTANNHSGDFGETCRRETEATLDRAGIAWSGPPGSIASVDVPDGAGGTAKVAVVAFHTSPSCNHLNDHDGAAALVKAADADHDLVIVSFHGGAEGKSAQHVPRGKEEFHGENRGDLRTFARVVIGAGADLVLGHGPHVARGMEVVEGRLVAYSLGNFATYGRFNLSGESGLAPVLEVVVDHEGAFVGGKVLAAKQVGRGGPVVDEEKLVVGVMKSLSEADFGEAAPLFGADGSIAPR